MKRIIAVLLSLMLLISAAAMAEITDEEGKAWAEANGYVLADTVSAATDTVSSATQTTVDAVSTATEKKEGGVNYGAIEWDEELQIAGVKEFLKGGTYLGDAAFAQDETGNNYREMYQMATIHNGKACNTNLELVLDASNLHLLGVSEAGTGKTLDIQSDPYVSVSWCRQLRVEEEDVYNYYCSYGVQYNGNVRIFTVADLETEEGQDALLNLYDKYYPTLASTWAAYSANFAGLTDETEIRDAKLAYISNALQAGSMVIYEIVPESIVITAPMLMNMSPTMANAARFTQVQEGEDKYAYTLGLSDAFIDTLIEYKNAYLATEEGMAQVTEYYSTGMYPTLDEYCAAYGASTSLELALMSTNAAGLKTQTTYIPAE